MIETASISTHKPTTVNKIGGANMSQLDVVKQLVDTLESRNENMVLVVSAFEGVTDLLTKAMDRISGTDYSEEDIDTAFLPVQAKHDEMIAKFFPGERAAEVKAKYETDFGTLIQSLMTHKQVSNVLKPKEGSFEIRDQVIGFGEHMSAAFLNIYLEQEGKLSRHFENVTADKKILEQGPITPERLHEAKKKGITEALRTETRQNVIRILEGHMTGTPKGLIPHQGRGYSDIMAVDTALAVKDMGEDLTETRFWKDVDGYYTANPKNLKVKEGKKEGKHKPKLHRDISYYEALENASAGSGLINVGALALAAKHELDLHIRNIQKFDPDFGTNITKGETVGKRLFKTIVSNPRIDAITITLSQMADQDGFAAAISAKFAEYELSIDQIGTDGTSMTFTTVLPKDAADQEECREKIRRIQSELEMINISGEIYKIENFLWDKEKATVSLTGSELMNNPDARDVRGFTDLMLTSSGIDVHMISHSRARRRYSYLIDSNKWKKAERLLHSYYVDNDPKVISKVEKRMKKRAKRMHGTFNQAA